MKLSKETVEILKNFATINNSLVLKKGKTQRTIAPQATILAEASIVEELPVECAIYNLNQLLGVLSIQGDADIGFGEKSMAIRTGESIVTYFYSANIVKAAPEKRIVLAPETVTAEFMLKSDDIQQAIKAASVLGLPEIVLLGRDGRAFIGACDSRAKSSNGFELAVGKASANYRMLFRLENIKVMPRNYNVQLSSKGIAYFQSEAKDLSYWIPTEVMGASVAATTTREASSVPATV